MRYGCPLTDFVEGAVDEVHNAIDGGVVSGTVYLMFDNDGNSSIYLEV